MLVRSWNLFHGNALPPQRRAFLDEMIALATADQPDVLCAQEVPGWALSRFPVGDMASRPPLGTTVGRALTSVHHGRIRGGVAGQGLGIWLGPRSTLVSRHLLVTNPRAVRRTESRRLHLARAARWTWARERRIVQVACLQVDGRRVVVANVHCTGYPHDSRIPDSELMRAAAFARSLARPDDVLVVAGDFNLRRPSSHTLARLELPGGGFTKAGPGVDHILVRGAAATRLRVWAKDRRRLPDGPLLSDHAPVELDIGPAGA